MIRRITYTISLLSFAHVNLMGQLSPGELSESHAHLEGISNCTQCHSLGHQVPDSKCLSCHTEINDLLISDHGYHASSEVKNKGCVSCHNDHHGRKFVMIKLDESSFDHWLTGYELEGAHVEIECRACHIPDFISDSDLKKREDTFLGLDTDCISCHEDQHQGTLSTDCFSCHTFDSFSPASRFDHTSAQFELTGAHSEVDCISCHPITDSDGSQYQQFTGLSFNSCVDCHDDVHNGKLPGNCKVCHTDNSFNQFIGHGRFNHNLTEFELKGKHINTKCFSCHSDNATPQLAFQDLIGTEENNCVSCHTDIHNGKLGNDCASCHNENGFVITSDVSFNHGLTDFPLEGLHQQVDCKSCHLEKLTDPINYTNCSNCHSDYHEGEFITFHANIDCIDCHSVENTFDFTTYGLVEHNESTFPLEGAHVATPCFMCHVSEDKWSFRNIGMNCIDCHDNVHDDSIPLQYYPENNCNNCHEPESWASIEFDHGLTSWPLEGKHQDVDCRSCHFKEMEDGIIIQTFSGVDVHCNSCHIDIHENQFKLNGITDCSRCHRPESWEASEFNHQLTSFPLDGEHQKLECSACHKEIAGNNDIKFIEYKIKKLDCIDCHSY